MQSLEAEFDSRGALREALLDTFTEGGIFVDGNYEITSGSPVCVRIGVKGLQVGVFIEGLVQWRRVGPTTRDSTISPGIGVRVLASERDRFDFLQAFANGSTDGAGRSEWRYPVDLKAFLTPAGRSTGRIVHTVLRDASTRGASVNIASKLSAGQIQVLEFQFDGDVRAIPARVAWSSDTRAGLVMLLEKQQDQAVWSQFVADTVTRFESRRVPRRRMTSKITIPPRV